MVKPYYDKAAAREKILRTITRAAGPMPDDCWITTQGLDRDGYGVIKLSNWPFQKHRAAYESFLGPIPEGLVIDHLCRVRSCCNPKHLEPVTDKENLLRGETHNARNARKTHCIRNHPLSGDNLYVSPKSQKRSCVTCNKARLKR